MTQLIPNTNPNQSQPPLTPPPAPTDTVAPTSPPLVDGVTPPVEPQTQEETTDSDFFAEFAGRFEKEYGLAFGDFVKSTKYVQDNFSGVHQDYTTRYEADSMTRLKEAWGQPEDFDTRYSEVNEAFQAMSPELQQQWLTQGETLMPGYAGAGAAIGISKALEERKALQAQNGGVPSIDRNSAQGNGSKPTYKRSQLRDKRWLSANNVTDADISLAWQEGRVIDDVS